MFPNAKVILTVREPETWYESVKGSIYNVRGVHKRFPSNLALWLSKRWNNLRVVNEISEFPPSGQDKGKLPAKKQ